MTIQNRREFFKTTAIIDVAAVTLPNASTKAEEKSKPSEDRICGFVNTAKSNDRSF